ncbi:MAG: ribonuclease III [Nitrospinota bacterium]|nr:MAG: ribonuclease III [Nitrospinota bacterium]
MTRQGDQAGQLEELQQRIGYRFRSPSLLAQALTHASFAHEQAGEEESYERLEFLGDAVLSLVISTYLFQAFPDFPEGQLSRWRAAIVQESILAEVARRLCIGTYLLLGRGEEQSGGREKDSLLADTLEAIIGAIYLDGGWDQVKQVVLQLFHPELRQVLHTPSPDPKSLLQQYTLERGEGLPCYRLVRTEGPDHAKTFVVETQIAGRIWGRGKGKSKKDAERLAAMDALRQLGVLAPEEPSRHPCR